MIDEMEQANLPEPLFKNQREDFIVTFYNGDYPELYPEELKDKIKNDTSNSTINSTINSTLNSTINSTLNSTINSTINPDDCIYPIYQKYPIIKGTCIKVLKLILEDKFITQQEIASKLGKSRNAISRHIKTLKDLKIIERIGSYKKGYWKINL